MTPTYVMTMQELQAIRKQAARERAMGHARMVNALIAALKSVFTRAAAGGFHAIH